MLEMASAAVMPHIQEGNAINHYAGYPNDAPVDITAITTDGTTRRFNFFVPDQEMPLRDYMVYRYRPPADHLPVFLEIREKFKKGEGAAAQLNPEQVDFVEQHVIPSFVALRPPLVEISASRRSK